MICRLNANSNKSRLFLNHCFKRLFSEQNELINEKNLHRISLITCKQLYDSNESKKAWYLRSGPKTGIKVNLECVDTKPNDKSVPTLVALHGAPGSHMDYTKLIRHFGDKYRVIVPNFPDFSLTESNNCFWHSAKEKAQFVRDVLKVLDVHRIDSLIVHSSAIFPASYLWSKQNQMNKLEIKSLCLLSNPGPKWFTLKSRMVTSTFVNISRIPLIRQYLRGIWSNKLTKRLGIKNRIERYDDLALLSSAYILSDTLTVKQRLTELKEQKIPTLSVFSLKDKLFKEEVIYSLLEILDPDSEVFDIYEEYQNRFVQKATKEDWIKVVNISGGGHYVFNTHSDIVHKYIEELLQRVKD